MVTGNGELTKSGIIFFETKPFPIGASVPEIEEIILLELEARYRRDMKHLPTSESEEVVRQRLGTVPQKPLFGMSEKA